MRQYFCSGFGGGATEDLLDCPEARVVEPFRKSHNIGSSYVFVLLRPRAARQLIRLDGSKDGKVQESNLVGEFLRRDTKGTANHGVHLGQGSVWWQTVGFL